MAIKSDGSAQAVNCPFQCGSWVYAVCYTANL